MSIFWEIYLIGVIVALFYITYEFKKFCDDNNLDFSSTINDIDCIFWMIFDSLGSWITVFIYYFGKGRI